MLRERFPALRHRDFRILWLGMFFSSATMMFQFYAQGWFILGLTSSAALLGLLGVSRGLGMLVFSLLGGAWADRMDRRTLLIATQSAALAVYGLLSVLVLLDRTNLWVAFGLIFVSASVESVDAPARQALIPHLVPRADLANAVALFMAAQVSAYAFLPPMAGLAISAFGPGGAFALSLVGHAVVVLALLVMRVRAHPGRPAESVAAGIALGIRYAASSPRVLWLLLFGLLVGTLGFPLISTLAPFWMERELGLGAVGWTMMGWTWGLGTIVSIVTLSARKGSGHLGRTAILSAVGFALTLVAFGLTRSIPLAAAAWCLNGTFFTANMISSSALLQLMVENEYMGRVASLRSISGALNQFAAAPLGAIADRAGIGLMVPAVAALLALSIVVPAVAVPAARSLGWPGKQPREVAPVRR
jgi:MFS family permease